MPLIVDVVDRPPSRRCYTPRFRSLERVAPRRSFEILAAWTILRSDADDVTVLPKTLMVDHIKAAMDIHIDATLVLIRVATRAAVSRSGRSKGGWPAYVEAGADAVGVQLSDVEEFRRVGAGSQAPLVSLSPKARMRL